MENDAGNLRNPATAIQEEREKGRSSSSSDKDATEERNDEEKITKEKGGSSSGSDTSDKVTSDTFEFTTSTEERSEEQKRTKEKGGSSSSSDTSEKDRSEERKDEEKRTVITVSEKDINGIIPLVLHTDDGELINWAVLYRANFQGYASLARLVRSCCVYDNTQRNIVHIISPWLRHRALYLDKDGIELNPMARWDEFSQKLREINMIPRSGIRPVIVSLPAMPDNNIVELPKVELGKSYWFRFQRRMRKTSTGIIPNDDKVFTVHRSSIRTYRRFFWIINGLWASWLGEEPLNAEDLDEFSVVCRGNNYIQNRPDEIRYLDYDGKRMYTPTFLKLYLSSMPKIGTEADEDDERDEEDKYPNSDPNYENTFDFLSRVVQVIVYSSSSTIQLPTSVRSRIRFS